MNLSKLWSLVYIYTSRIEVSFDIINLKCRASLRRTRSTSSKSLPRLNSRRAKLSQLMNRSSITMRAPDKTTKTKSNYTLFYFWHSSSHTSQSTNGKKFAPLLAMAHFDLHILAQTNFPYELINHLFFCLIQKGKKNGVQGKKWIGRYIQWINNQIMIRGEVIAVVLLGVWLAQVGCSQFEALQIENVERTVNLAGHYPTEIIKATLHADSDGIAHFSFLLPLDYDSHVSRISFTRGKDRNALNFHRSVYIYNGGSFANYRVKLPFNLNIDEEVEILVQILYLDRYVNLPQSISLSEDQRLQYEDIKHLVSPYAVRSQKSTYKYAKIIEFDQDGERKGLSEVTFSANDQAPFTVTRHTVFGVNNNPQVKFTQVEKVLEVSHWGNVGITENYRMVNTGPSLKGEFSRVTYGSRSQADARNAYKGIEFDLPYEIWGLYYQDEVGNISTSKAYRDESSHTVHVALQPRFALLGGWKSNWQMGYNFKTDGHLFHDGSRFELRNIKLEYALEKVVAEEFRIKIILPHGAENVKIKIGGHEYDMSLVEQTTSEGYLDFSGRPTFIIDSFTGSPKDKYLDVSYDYAVNNTYEKPISLFAIVLGFLLFAIFIKRFKLEAFADTSIKSE